MKNLLRLFLGIFVLLNLSGIAYAGNYTTANGCNNTGHSLAYQYRMAEKKKAQSSNGMGTVIFFIVVNILFVIPALLKWDNIGEEN